jgi:hypothetical protein
MGPLGQPDDVVETEVRQVTQTGGRVTITFGFGAAGIEYLPHADGAPLLPAEGAATLRGLPGTCTYGGSCPGTFLELETEREGPLVALGRLVRVNGEDRGPTPSGISFRSGTNRDVCPLGDDRAEVPAVAQVPTDDGVIELLPSENRVVTRDGDAFMVRAGASVRSVEHVIDEPPDDCLECPEPGRYVTLEVEVLVYRTAE